MRNQFVLLAAVAVTFGVSFAFAEPFAILQPGDPIRAFDHDLDQPASSSPGSGNENVEKVIDGLTSSKYLNFGREGTGFIVTPTAPSIIQSFQLTTANDASDRDPASYRLYGTNEAIVSTNHSTGLGESWTLLGQGPLPLPPVNSFMTPYAPVDVDNATSYNSYKLIFPTLRITPNSCCMQVSEAQFYDASGGPGAGSNPILAPTNPILAVDDPINQSQSRYPITVATPETPDRAIDRIAGPPPALHTKHLNFGRENSGVIVTPSSGPSIIDGIQFTTANDAASRDPVLLAIFGTNDPITSPDNSFGNNENWTLIVNDLPYAAPTDRFTPGPIAIFENAASYASYKIVVLDNRGPDAPAAGGANSVQYAEVQLFSGAIPEPSTLALTLAGTLGLALRRRRD